uniref:Uncharacterized protein n=1 Tax=Oryza brachyantha TaxID=4533 RepID=J3L2H9_ORYBR
MPKIETSRGSTRARKRKGDSPWTAATRATRREETLASLRRRKKKKAMVPREGTRMAGLREREVGRIPPKLFANSVMASQDFVRSLGLQKRLRKHGGFVNTIGFNGDGNLLLSGSDDRTAVLWNWQDGTPTFTFHTGHSNNVLHAQFMPFSGDRSIVTCDADGQFDLREKDVTELFKCAEVDNFSGDTIEVYAITIDSRKPSSFAVAGSDEYVRVYDSRKIHVDGGSSFGRPIEYFCPPHMIGENEDGITGLAFSQTSELLASYSYDNIYLFSREHGLHFNNIEVGERLLMDETEGDCHINTAPLPFCRDKLPVPQTFKGHRNKNTIKGVNFLGPNCDYVTTGSDCGRVFIWRKKDGDLMRVMKGDKRIVNCVEQHPSGIVIASSGIEKDIKIWAPGENPDEPITDTSSVTGGSLQPITDATSLTGLSLLPITDASSLTGRKLQPVTDASSVTGCNLKTVTGDASVTGCNLRPVKDRSTEVTGYCIWPVTDGFMTGWYFGPSKGECMSTQSYVCFIE